MRVMRKYYDAEEVNDAVKRVKEKLFNAGKIDWETEDFEYAESVIDEELGEEK